MKKFLLMLLVMMAAIPGAMAQNANRSGFFGTSRKPGAFVKIRD